MARAPVVALVEQLSEAVGRDLGDLLVGRPEVLRATRNAQLATFTVSLVALDAVRNGPLARS